MRCGQMMRQGVQLALILATGFLSACSTMGTDSGPDFSVTKGLQSPPVAYQVACASEAERKFGLRENSVFPLGSGADGRGTYYVHVYTPKGDAMCVFEETGTLVSVSRI